jgi:DNA primase (bacterial type)
MGNLKEYPFDIRDIVLLLNLKVKHKNPSSWDVNCPFCGNRKGKLNINTVKNVFRCNYCAESGGMLALYGKVYNLSNKEAYEEIIKSLHLGLNAPDYQVKENEKGLEIENSTRASEKEIHQTYLRLLEYLSLSEGHKKAIQERGLTEEQIAKHNYKSTPLFGFKQLTERLIREGYTVKGVPGFYSLKDGSWSMNVSARNGGFFIPIISIDGLIQGMQIRLDKPYNGMKYLWFSSSNKENGVTSGSPVHFIGDVNRDVIYLTEGALKGNIAHEYAKHTMLCVAGVNQYKHLPELLMRLKKSGMKYLIEAYDMDKLLNPVCRADHSEYCQECAEKQVGQGCKRKITKLNNIQRGCLRVYEICHEINLPCTRFVWDIDEKGFWKEEIKGIDDYYGS